MHLQWGTGQSGLHPHDPIRPALLCLFLGALICVCVCTYKKKKEKRQNSWVFMYKVSLINDTVQEPAHSPSLDGESAE